MRNRALAADHIRRAAARLLAVDALYRAESWADVVRESQEVVELALKGLLHAASIDPPRLHDVSEALETNRDRLPPALADEDLARLAAASRELRRDRGTRLLRRGRHHTLGVLPAGRRRPGAGIRPDGRRTRAPPHPRGLTAAGSGAARTLP